MIKVRVDWRQKCPDCGTELVTDFFDDSASSSGCPWCGCVGAMGHGLRGTKIEESIVTAVHEIERRINESAPVGI